MNVQQKTQATVQCEGILGRQLRNGEYLIRQVLGQGGIGTVYLAWHTTLSTPFALKQLRADQPLPEAVMAELNYILHGGDIAHRATRGDVPYSTFPSSGGEHTDHFLREALLLARLQHPAVPTLYDYFFEDGYWYLVMDYIAGATFGAYLLHQAPLAPLHALGYAMQLCDVLDFLHKQVPPVIFRDLKPSNIMLLPDGTLVLIDFGSAQYLSGQHYNDSTGSPGYAAPEQYLDEGQLDVRSDLYSLGALLHQMVSGQHPSGSLWEALTSARQSNRDVSTVLSGLIELATRSEPGQRFQSAHTFYLALERAYTIEEQRAYQRLALREDGEPLPPLANDAAEAISGEQVLANAMETTQVDIEVPIFPGSFLDLEERRHTREVLHLTRQERLLQQQIEHQLTSVDEGLQRRSALSLPQTGQRGLEQREAIYFPPVRRFHRMIQISFLLALILFVVMASTQIYMRLEHPTRNVADLQLLPTVVLTPTKHPQVLSPTITVLGAKIQTTTSYWQALPSLPAPQADNSAAYVTVQGRSYIYLSGGYRSAATPSYDHNLYRYDIAAAHWETVTTSNFPGMVDNVAAVDESGHIFFTAGYSSDTYQVTSRLYQYLPADGTLSTITPPSQIPIGFGGALLADQQGHLYMTQGFMQAGKANIQAGNGWYRYDIASGRWHQLTPLPVGSGYAGLTLDSKGTILLLGGASDAGQHNQKNAIYRYDSVNDSWTQEPVLMPQTISGGVSCLLWPDEMLIVGGYDIKQNKGEQSAWLFDLRTLHWNALPDLPAGGSVLGAAACDGKGHAYLARGASNPAIPTQDFLQLVVPAASNGGNK